MGNQCNDVVIPKVDNSSPECDKYIKDICVHMSSGQPFLGLIPGKNLKEVIFALVERLKVMQKEISDLKESINNLNT
jgi:hypothetical protein